MSTAYDILQTARAAAHPSGKAAIKALCNDFMELRGDRRFADDGAIIGGVGHIGKLAVTVIAHERGAENLAERARRNFGMAHPEGYRKALRLMKQAEKFGRPVLCLVDTSGAFCGIGAEERGQGQAIAENLCEMMALKVPVIAVVLGEGGSGGALALAVANEVWMMENAVYSVISPEGCSSILWKDTGRVKEAAEALKITPEDLLRLGVIERIVPEAPKERTFPTLKKWLVDAFTKMQKSSGEELCAARYARFRAIGVYSETPGGA